MATPLAAVDRLREMPPELYTAKTDGGARIKIAPPTLEPSRTFPVPQSAEAEPSGDQL